MSRQERLEQRERELHVAHCRELGISEEDATEAMARLYQGSQEYGPGNRFKPDFNGPKEAREEVLDAFNQLVGHETKEGDAMWEEERRFYEMCLHQASWLLDNLSEMMRLRAERLKAADQ